MSSRWPGKYVIGLTGNIGTGKSVVRKMLEHLGVFSLDADTLAQQATAKGGPAYTAVVKMFGEWILNEDGEINRARLSQIAFADAKTLLRLESVIHPSVGQAIDFLVKRSQAHVVVIEAIKLIEAGLAKDCDAVWVVNVNEATQIARLVEKRKMTEAEVRQRLSAQSPQSEKIKIAKVVIDNSGSYEDTWTQVQNAFNQLTQPAASAPPPPPTPVATPPTPTPSAPPPVATPVAPVASPPTPTPSTPPPPPTSHEPKTVKIRRGKPTDANAIAALIKIATNNQRVLSRGDIMAAFGDKAYMLADYDNQTVAIVGWKVENLVARVDEVYVIPGAPIDKLSVPLLEAVENASRELQSEAALVFIPLPIAQPMAQALIPSGFTPAAPDKLGVAAWREAARESMPTGTAMLFKKLREDRVLKPI